MIATPPGAVNLYDSSEGAYAAKMSQFASQPLSRSKRRRSSVTSNVSNNSVHNTNVNKNGAASLKQSPRKADSAAASVLKARAQSAKPLAEARTRVSTYSAPQPARARADRETNAVAGGRDVGVGAVGFQLRYASSSAGSFRAANLLQYSTATCWQSFSRAKETIVLVL